MILDDGMDDVVLNYAPISTCRFGSHLLGEDLGDTYWWTHVFGEIL
jgi:hypothetical protein